MKKAATVFALLIALVTFTPPAALGGEVDILIKKLVDKGILTDSDAEALRSEIQREAAEEQSEVEAMVKETATDVAKMEVESKEFKLPKGLEGVSIGGTYFLEYFSQEFDDEPGGPKGDFDSFRVERAYITVKKKFAPWFSSRVTTDITYDQSRDESGSEASEIGWAVRLKYASGLFDLNDLGGQPLSLQSEFGLVHTFSDMYDAALWPYRPQGKHYLDRHSIMASADFGLNAHLAFGGSMDEEFQKRVSNAFAAKWGGLWAGVYNGPGYTKAEDNDKKVWEIAGYVRPFNMIDALKGFRIGAHVLRGESNEFLQGTTYYGDWDINQVMTSYQHEYFTIMAQYYEGKGEDTEDDENDRDGYNIAAFIRMPFDKNLRAFGRYIVYDHDKDASNLKEKTSIFGLSYDLAKTVMPWVAIENKDWEDGHTKENDYTMYQVGLLVSF
jgi:hypothetical protein